MAAWYVALEQVHPMGELLTREYAGSPVTIVQDAEGYWLTADCFVDKPDSGSVVTAAQGIIDVIKKVLELEGYGSDIMIGTIVRNGDTGQRHASLSISATASFARINAPTVTGGGRVSATRTHMQSATALALRDENVNRALTFFAQDTSWGNLYKVYELIKKVVGRNRISEWMTDAEDKRFRHTANHPAASGDAARHATSTQAPPKNPMTLAEGKAFVRTLLGYWLNSKQ